MHTKSVKEEPPYKSEAFDSRSSRATTLLSAHKEKISFAKAR